jgi:class 3 adenylate cyclase
VSDFPTGTVTVMFTDLVGSTAERDRLGDAAADAVRRVHDHALRDAIESCGGRIVKSTGDGFMAAFSGAADGVRAAVHCQRTAQRVSRQAGVPFEVRIGVAVGDVELDAGDYFGLSVVQAARLCDAAGGNEILVTELVKALAGTWVEIEYGPPMAMSLKGISADVVAHRVDWQTSDIARPPFPTALRSDDELQFVGRAEELETLQTVYTRFA